jgi:hypothetical protein
MKENINEILEYVAEGVKRDAKDVVGESRVRMPEDK